MELEWVYFEIASHGNLKEWTLYTIFEHREEILFICVFLLLSLIQQRCFIINIKEFFSWCLISISLEIQIVFLTMREKEKKNVFSPANGICRAMTLVLFVYLCLKRQNVCMMLSLRQMNLSEKPIFTMH